MLTFVHLSDLHIGQDGAEEVDRDEDPRNELIEDCRRVIADLQVDVTGVLISGDIANTGDPDEYQRARIWLASLCQALGIPEENVWTVPGNHDFTRGNRTALWHNACDGLRQCEEGEIDAHLRSHLNSDDRHVLLSPFRDYHEFADGFGCVPEGPVQVWDEKFELSEDMQLRVFGLNTATLADGEETDEGDGLVLGENAVQLRRNGETFILAMWHHPLGWLRDESTARRYLNSRACIHLFGHEHDHCLSCEGGRLVVSAGALHPRRGDRPWEPRYNLIQLSPAGPTVADGLNATVVPRIWDEGQTTFTGEDGTPTVRGRDFLVGTGPTLKAEGASEGVHDGTPAVNAMSESYKETADDQAGGKVANRRRRLWLKYATLPFVRRIVIAGELGLLDESDRDVAGFEQTRLVLDRAAREDRLRELWDAVAAELGDEEIENPYASVTI
ncbi:MAG TPA: metallophosphoesterase [Solirubrobacterales bacterium]|nr:metallophosphoesterase [Solirubrobacterales bacterium]